MEAKDFIINVGPHGTFRPSGNYQTIPEHVDAMFERFKAENVKKITLYFHGGLVPEKSGTETAFKMAEQISAIGHTPVCFVWETGLGETLFTNIVKINDTKLFNKIIKSLVKVLSAKLGFDEISGRGAGGLSDAQIDAELFSATPFENYSQKAMEDSGRGAEIIAAIPTDETLLMDVLEGEFTIAIQTDPEFEQAIQETKLTVDSGQEVQSRGILSSAAFVKHVAKIAFQVIKRFLNKRDHNFYPTIIEEALRELYIAELGAWVWNNMKIKARQMWEDNQNNTGLNQLAGRYFLDKLMNYAAQNNGVEVNLVGHSAGSIAICNLLAATSKSNPAFVYNKIIFMAPACRADLFYDEMATKTERFKHFRMYTMTDAFEVKDRLVKFVYTHSLLYLISGVLEDEGNDFDAYVLGLERHIAAKPPYDTDDKLKAINAFLYDAQANRLNFSKTGDAVVMGLRTTSESHGGFDDDVETIKSLRHYLTEA